jgi:hypothetical protein
MGATVVIQKTHNTDKCKIVLAKVTMDSSYLTGGELVTPANFGLSGIYGMICGNPPLGGFIATYDPVTGSIPLWVSTTATPGVLTQLGSTVSAATAVVPVVVFGY